MQIVLICLSFSKINWQSLLFKELPFIKELLLRAKFIPLLCTYAPVMNNDKSFMTVSNKTDNAILKVHIGLCT